MTVKDRFSVSPGNKKMRKFHFEQFWAPDYNAATSGNKSLSMVLLHGRLLFSLARVYGQRTLLSQLLGPARAQMMIKIEKAGLKCPPLG